MDFSRYTICPDDSLYEITPAHKQEKPASTWVSGEFLKGPIPLSWLTPASGLPGKGLQVGLAIWFEYGRRKKLKFRLSSAIFKRFNVNRKAVYRGLEALEEAGLITVIREHGKNPEVTLVLKKEDPS